MLNRECRSKDIVAASPTRLWTLWAGAPIPCRRLVGRRGLAWGLGAAVNKFCDFCRVEPDVAPDFSPCRSESHPKLGLALHAEANSVLSPAQELCDLFNGQQQTPPV